MTKTQNFITSASVYHNNLYTYEKTIYTSTNDSIIVTCSHHGDFTTTPHKHLRGKGCSKCARELFDFELFVKKSNKKHKNFYTYPESTLYDDGVKIICPHHGEFLMNRHAHIRGYGCPRCGIKNKKTTADFINESKEIHGDLFLYDKTEYVSLSNKVTITCRIHGEFQQHPRDHLIYKAGCPKCSEKQKMTTETFIEKANKRHNNKYTYHNTSYITIYKDVTITCPKHGDFVQPAANHLKGRGCYKCSKTFSQKEHNWLNWLNIPDDPLHRQIKIKINGTICRVDGFDPATNTIYEFLGDFWHGNPKRFAPSDTNSATKTTYQELYCKTFERIAQLKKLGYIVVYIWESDYDNYIEVFNK